MVQQRQSIADGLARIMKDLGLERREKVETINDMIENTLKQAEDDDNEHGSDGQP